jgi:hypothetical protein
MPTPTLTLPLAGPGSGWTEDRIGGSWRRWNMATPTLTLPLKGEGGRTPGEVLAPPPSKEGVRGRMTNSFRPPNPRPRTSRDLPLL